MTEMIGPVPKPSDDQQLAQELVERARAEGVELLGPGGLLTGLTKTVLETALEAEISDHLGYDKHDPAGRNRQGGGSSGYIFLYPDGATTPPGVAWDATQPAEGLRSRP